MDIVNSLDLKVYTEITDMSREITGGYASDLLSDVMGNAQAGNIWITLQTHINIVAVASLKDIGAIILVKGLQPEQNTLQKALDEGILILGTPHQTFEISGMLYQLLYSNR
jgi:predicted transcriptional regulator